MLPSSITFHNTDQKLLRFIPDHPGLNLETMQYFCLRGRAINCEIIQLNIGNLNFIVHLISFLVYKTKFNVQLM